MVIKSMEKVTKNITAEDIWKIMEEVYDPEIPVLSVSDLGIIRDIKIINKQVEIIITPTYSGCPAMDLRSQAARYLGALPRAPLDTELLQVYFPHLEDTVEVLQVRRVLDRMNVFLRLMHEGLTTAGQEDKTINTLKEFATQERQIPKIRDRLKSAFPVQLEQLQGEVRQLAVTPDKAAATEARFLSIPALILPGLEVRWEPTSPKGLLLGTTILGARCQPFTLLLQSFGERPLIRCISPVGRMDPRESQELLKELGARQHIRFGAIVRTDEQAYDLTVEEDVFLLADGNAHDAARIEWLVHRVTEQADFIELECMRGIDQPLAKFRADLEREHDDR